MNLRRILLLFLFASLAPATAPAAIDLDNGDYLTWASAPATAVPLTMYARFSGDSFPAAAGHFVAIREGTNIANGGFDLGHNNSAQARCYAVEASSFAVANLTSPALGTGTWYHAFARFNTTTDRWIQIDANEAQNTQLKTPAGLSQTIIGQTNTEQFLGQIAEVCIWNDTLTSGERDAVRNGARPCAVRPSAVVFYCSGLTTTAEIGGAPTVTLTPTIVAHPTVMYVTRLATQTRRRH